MDVTTIQMDPEAAREKMEYYREVLKGRHAAVIDQEFQAIEAACEELAKGTPLINPIEAIRDCGWRPDGRPKLAIGRADKKQVQWRISRDSRRWHHEKCEWSGNYAPMTWSFEARNTRRDTSRSKNLHFEVPDVRTNPPIAPVQGVAMMPLVPAEVYPSRGLNLSRYFVLWEVENWDYAPPIDPMLLRHLGGELYAVVAQWDLTPLERAIISGTRRPE